jgi:hypothetical protein
MDKEDENEINQKGYLSMIGGYWKGQEKKGKNDKN